LLNDTRLVVDLPAVSSALGQSVIYGRHGLLKKIRVGHHADKVRLVFDLTDRPVYSIKEDRDSLLVTLKPDREGVASLAPAQPAIAPEVTPIDRENLKVRFEPATRVVKNTAKMINPVASTFRVQPVQMVSDNAGPRKR
jgi:Localisation of periplasmic protein complexes.